MSEGQHGPIEVMGQGHTKFLASVPGGNFNLTQLEGVQLEKVYFTEYAGISSSLC